MTTQILLSSTSLRRLLQCFFGLQNRRHLLCLLQNPRKGLYCAYFCTKTDDLYSFCSGPKPTTCKFPASTPNSMTSGVTSTALKYTLQHLRLQNSVTGQQKVADRTLKLIVDHIYLRIERIATDRISKKNFKIGSTDKY